MTLYLALNQFALESVSFEYEDSLWNPQTNIFGYSYLKPHLYDRGVYILANGIFDFNWPAKGGIKTRNFPLNQYLIDVQLGLESEKLVCYKGGRFFCNFLYHQSDSLSSKYVGDFQGVDNLNAPNLVQLAQLWYQQKLFKQQLIFQIGKIDSYVIFNYVGYAQTLLNNSFSQNPTILGFPTYPNSAVGVIAQYFPFKWLDLKVSIFDGASALGVQTGNQGAKGFFNNLGKHALLLNEIDFKWGQLKDVCPGAIGIGIWGLTATLPNFSEGTLKGTAGVYLMVTQTLWKERAFSKKQSQNQLRDIGVFGQWGICNKEVNVGRQYLGFGATAYNLYFCGGDALSVGMATALFTNAKGASYPDNFEMSLEATYKFPLLNELTIQPDFQYVIHPGGAGLPNAIVVSLRLMASI
ncbi:MAG: hypothetical protein S4CHLAM7_02670 [Chlamydiae bacterium]|nr:hypothetical protein [Chlamydiota bacterium]